MPQPEVLVLVLAGGQGSRLGALTMNRAKPAVSFAGEYRLIDFPLSNCLHSAISDVWVLQQYQPASLNDHLSNGRPWDLDRTTGGLVVLPPYQGSDREGWTQGTADGLWRNASMIRDLGPKHVVVVSADAVYRMNYRDVLADHGRSGAELTMVTTEVDPADADRYGVVELDGDRVTGYQLKPDEPRTNVVSNEVFVFDPEPVLERLDELADKAGEDGLQDLGHHLLPSLVDDGQVHNHSHTGYWRDVGTLESYWTANMEFLSDDPPFDLDDPQWPVRTKGGLRSPGWLTGSAEVRSSLVSSSSRIAGTVSNCVIGPRVEIKPGAHVEDSILLTGCTVLAGAHVTRAIVDDDVVIGLDARVGGAEDVTLIGDRTEVRAGSRIKAGSQVPEPS